MVYDRHRRRSKRQRETAIGVRGDIGQAQKSSVGLQVPKRDFHGLLKHRNRGLACVGRLQADPRDQSLEEEHGDPVRSRITDRYAHGNTAWGSNGNGLTRVTARSNENTTCQCQHETEKAEHDGTSCKGIAPLKIWGAESRGS